MVPNDKVRCWGVKLQNYADCQHTICLAIFFSHFHWRQLFKNNTTLDECCASWLQHGFHTLACRGSCAFAICVTAICLNKVVAIAAATHTITTNPFTTNTAAILVLWQYSTFQYCKSDGNNRNSRTWYATATSHILYKQKQAIKATVSAPKTQTLKLACVTRGRQQTF